MVIINNIINSRNSKLNNNKKYFTLTKTQKPDISYNFPKEIQLNFKLKGLTIFHDYFIIKKTKEFIVRNVINVVYICEWCEIFF